MISNGNTITFSDISVPQKSLLDYSNECRGTVSNSVGELSRRDVSANCLAGELSFPYKSTTCSNPKHCVHESDALL